MTLPDTHVWIEGAILLAWLDAEIAASETGRLKRAPDSPDLSQLYRGAYADALKAVRLHVVTMDGPQRENTL